MNGGVFEPLGVIMTEVACVTRDLKYEGSYNLHFFFLVDTSSTLQSCL